jgi:hypothetical protein
MPFWRNANPKAHLSSRRCSGRFLRRALFLSITITTMSAAQETQHRPATKQAVADRVNGLTLAGLRPGGDKLGRAVQLFPPSVPKASPTTPKRFGWTLVASSLSPSISTPPRKSMSSAPASPSQPPFVPWSPGHPGKPASASASTTLSPKSLNSTASPIRRVLAPKTVNR